MAQHHKIGKKKKKKKEKKEKERDKKNLLVVENLVPKP
jgi:hypothetical protein